MEDDRERQLSDQRLNYMFKLNIAMQLNDMKWLNIWY